jgi:hypothetical protein
MSNRPINHPEQHGNAPQKPAQTVEEGAKRCSPSSFENNHTPTMNPTIRKRHVWQH